MCTLSAVAIATFAFLQTAPSNDLDGTWEVESWTQGRQPFPVHGHGVPARWEIKDGMMSIFSRDGLIVDKLRITIDKAHAPARFKVTYEGSDERFKERYKNGFLGIFKVEDGKLIRSFTDTGDRYPTEFSGDGQEQNLQVLRPSRKPRKN